MKQFLFLVSLLVSCDSLQNIVVAPADGIARKVISSTCLPDAFPTLIVDECGNDPRNYVPLTASGFLYADGNSMPVAHRAAGVAAGVLVQPLNDAGQPASTGKIYVDAEGMSNALRVFDAFALKLAGSSLDNSKIRFRNKSLGGVDLQEWVDSLGVGAIDVKVQVVLLYHSLTKNFSGCSQQTYIDTTRYYLRARLLQLKIKYPNLKQVFIQSRELGAWKCYSTPGAAAEPAAWLNGFGVKNFVDLQVSGGDPALAYASAPFMAWGIYPWDGVTPRSWFESPGLHPCTTGSNFWAQQWFDFLLNDSTTRSWFAANP